MLFVKHLFCRLYYWKLFDLGDWNMLMFFLLHIQLSKFKWLRYFPNLDRKYPNLSRQNSTSLSNCINYTVNFHFTLIKLAKYNIDSISSSYNSICWKTAVDHVLTKLQMIDKLHLCQATTPSSNKSVKILQEIIVTRQNPDMIFHSLISRKIYKYK